MTSSILVFDIGTTSVKSALFNIAGIPIASASVAYKTKYPQSGWAEQDPLQFWQAAIKATRQLLTNYEIKSSTIHAIGVTGHMNGSLMVDAKGNPTHPCLIHADTRSQQECKEIIDIWGQQEIYKRTGNRMDEHLSLPKLLWLKHHQPIAFGSCAWVLNAKDFLRFKLTGNLGTTDYSDASITGAFDQRRLVWDTELLASIHIPPSIFPQTKASIELDGNLSPSAAHLLGLPSGIPVSMGGGDAACATRGARIAQPQQAYACIGSSAWISTLVQHPVTDAHMRMQHFLDLEGKLYNVCATVQSAGSAVDWARRILATQRDYAKEEIELKNVPIGSNGVLFLPYLMGERTPHWNALARGVFFGLSLSNTKQTLLRAVYEGVAFALCECLHLYNNLHIPIDSFTLIGGGAQSVFWQEMLADTLNRKVFSHPYSAQATALGAAMAAGVSVGVWKSIQEAIDTTEIKLLACNNNYERSQAYARVYATYIKLYPALQLLYEAKNTAHINL